MNLLIAAIGKSKPGPERVLYEHYAKRIPWKMTLKEYELKKQLPSLQRKEQEADLLLDAVKQADYVIALDEKGKDLNSIAFAAQLQKCQDQDRHNIAFIIGGADGLHDTIQKRADLLLSFGRLTWPHMLVRGLLAEQLYRSYSILSNHPYHRE
jgi:23S rRNA (pseudouridine1915-N3)-methyltransferase